MIDATLVILGFIVFITLAASPHVTRRSGSRSRH